MAITSRALAFASRWFDEATVARVFQPLVADWQREWQDAPASRRWSTLLSGLWAFIVATIVTFPRIVLTPAPPTVMNRVVARVARFTLLGSAVLVAPFVLGLPGAWLPASMVLFVVPQALTAVFPFAMVPAVDAIRRHEALPPYVERGVVTKVGLAAVLLMMVFHGWVTPAANQAWRRAALQASLDDDRPGRQVPPGLPARGMHELTTIELIVDPSHAYAGDIIYGGRAAELRRELNNRVSFAVLPVFFLWLRWRSLDLPRRRWSPLPAGIAVVAMIGGYVLLRGLFEDGLSMPRGMGAWMAPVAMLAFSQAEQWLCRRQSRSVA
jgi:hypothetical protein